MINISASTNTSVLKSKAIYGDLLSKENYKWYQIDDLAVTEYIEFEHERISEPAELHLLAVKKILLYAIPVISPPAATSTRGITLTAQFDTECIINNSSKERLGLVPGDKYTLVGFAFAPELVNHIDISSFEWKYYYKYPQEYVASEVDLTHLSGIKKQPLRHSDISQIYLVETSHFEDVDLYNKILRLIKLKLDEYTHALTLIQRQCDETNHIKIEKYTPIPALEPYNNTPTIHKLNQILEKQIDATFTLSYYETLQATANWLLYNQIFLYGYDSGIVGAYLDKLKYIKEENRRVFLRLAKDKQDKLEQTRAEKITREQYPFYFSDIDRRGIFVRFNRFDLNKLSKQHQADVRMLLEKELAYQRALIENKCPHIKLIKRVALDHSLYKELEAFVDFDRKTMEDHTYYCKNCTYPLLCEHEVEFYSNVLISETDESSNDQLYAVQQNIINKFKSTQQKFDQTDSFSYFCKYCSLELGKSDDIIQISMKETVARGYAPIEHDETRNMIYFTLANILSTNVDPLVLQIDRKKVLRALLTPVKEQMDDIIYSFRKFKDENKIELHTKFSALVMSLCAIISLSVNVLKTSKPLLQAELVKKVKRATPRVQSPKDSSTEESSEEEQEQPSILGGSIKDEFANAFAIIKNSPHYSALVVSDDKIKAMLIDYYRKIAKDVGDLVDASTMIKSDEDRFAIDVQQSAVYAYLRYIVSRNKNMIESDLPFESVMGTAVLKNKSKAQEGTAPEYIYSKLPTDTVKRSDAKAKYISESFENIRSFLTTGRYRGTEVEPEISKLIVAYELEQNKQIAHSTKNPRLYLRDVAPRENKFILINLNLIYCATTQELSKHQWVDGVCSVCNINIKNISSTTNARIEELINNNINKNAFFEMYTINCPVKDMHLFENNICAQCGVTKQQLISGDSKYYKKYLPKFEEYRKGVLKLLLFKTNSITQLKPYTEPPQPIINQSDSDIEANTNKIILIISKVFEVKQSDIMELSEDSIDSYIRLVYERYAYAKNVSYDMSKHADIEFYDFIKSKFFKGANPIKVTMSDLPAYDYQNYKKDIKLYQLLRQFDAIVKNDSAAVISLGKFLIKKIIAQEARRKNFNFAKLKSFKSDMIETEELIFEASEDDDGENGDDDTSLFMAYDIDMEDIDDNIEGDLD